MVDLEVWYDEDQNDAVIVRTPAELDAVLDTVAGREGRVLVDLYVVGNPGRANFNVGLHGRAGRGALYYASSGQKWFSTETPGPDWSADEPVLYYLMNSDTEYPADSEIPLDVVRRAAHEFMTTGGERPTASTWRAAPDWW
ncbi:Imm1 family immunity protein [Actinosynnema sp. NPDC059797]